MNICVSGTNTIAPIGMPKPIYAIALPRSRTNHFSAGTDVTSAPGPLIPTNPIAAYSATKCQASVMNASAIIAKPVTSAAAGSIAREP